MKDVLQRTNILNKRKSDKRRKKDKTKKTRKNKKYKKINKKSPKKNNRKRWKNGQNKSPKVSLRRLNQSPEELERNIFLLTPYNIAAPTGKTITMMILMMRTEKRVLDSTNGTINLGSMVAS